MFAGKSAGLLHSKSNPPFLKMGLVNFLSGIHETILLNKVNMNRTVRANVAKACLEMLLEQLSQQCGKMKRYWLLRTNENTNIRSYSLTRILIIVGYTNRLVDFI